MANCKGRGKSGRPCGMKGFLNEYCIYHIPSKEPKIRQQKLFRREERKIDYSLRQGPVKKETEENTNFEESEWGMKIILEELKNGRTM